jgi:hypothetical protein
LQHRLFETRVTRTAKRLRQFVPAKSPGIEDLRLVEVLRFHRYQMFFARSMTRFTTDARTKLVQPQLQPLNRARRMTTKTLLRLVTGNGTAEGVFE